MAQQKKHKEGKHQKYGPKLPNPRIKRTKERRSCGPLGYATRARENETYFSTRAKLFPIVVSPTPVVVALWELPENATTVVRDKADNFSAKERREIESLFLN